MDRVLGFPSAKDDSYGGCQSGVETDNRYNDVIHAMWARRDITLTRPAPAVPQNSTRSTPRLPYSGTILELAISGGAGIPDDIGIRADEPLIG